MEILSEIKIHHVLDKIPVVILSSSNTPNDISEAFSLGAYDFIVKPGTYKEYLNIMEDLRPEWL